MFNEFFKEMDVSITPKKANISGRWVFDGQVNRTQMGTDRGPVTTVQEEEKQTTQDQVPDQPDQDQHNQDLTRIGGMPNQNSQDQETPRAPAPSVPVPESTDPLQYSQVELPGNTTVEDIIQILDDHIAQSVNNEKPPSETDPLEQEEQESESKLEKEGIVNVSDSSESDNDEITVNPTKIETGPETGEQTGDSNTQEHNNNHDERKTITQRPSSWKSKTPTTTTTPGTNYVPGTWQFVGVGGLAEIHHFLINLPMGTIADAAPLHRVTSYLTFDTIETRDRIWKAAKAVKQNTNYFSGNKEYYYFTEIAKRTKPRRQNHTEDEHQEMGEEAENTQEEKRAIKPKNRSGEKSATAPAAEPPSAADDLSTLVRDVSSMVPVSKIDKTQERNQVGQNFLESTRLDDENAVEVCLREDTKTI